MRKTKQKYLLHIIVLCFPLSGCGLYGQSIHTPLKHENNHVDQELAQTYNADDTYHKAIIQNLVYTLIQLDEVDPSTTLVSIAPRWNIDMHDDAIHALTDAGYQITITDEKYSKNLVSLKETPLGDDVKKYTLSLGNVSASRDYHIDQKTVSPVGAITISGAQATHVITNDYVFDVASQSGVIFDAPGYRQRSESFTSENNVFETMASNFEHIFQDYSEQEQITVYFDNDSLFLGDHGKTQLRKLIDVYDPDADIISIIGCSFGPTAIDNGNEVLAKGRAERIKEELIYSGLQTDSIHDEGCWAPAPITEVFPSRGVVVTLKKRKI